MGDNPRDAHKIRALMNRVESLIVENAALARDLKLAREAVRVHNSAAELGVRALDRVLLLFGVEFGEYSADRMPEFAAAVAELVLDDLELCADCGHPAEIGRA